MPTLTLTFEHKYRTDSVSVEIPDDPVLSSESVMSIYCALVNPTMDLRWKLAEKMAKGGNGIDVSPKWTNNLALGEK